MEDVIEKNQFNIFKYSYQMIRNKEAAEDITQEVFIKFFKLSNKKEYSSSYLFAIAHNECIDYLRKEKRKSFFLNSFHEKTYENSAENVLNESKFSYEVEEALNTLTSYERSVLLLRSINELSYKEIAELLNKKESTVRKQFQRAKTKIQKRLNARKEICNNEEVSVF